MKEGLSPMKKWYFFLALVVVYAVVAPLRSTNRVIDGDEGFYASAARLVGEGKIPYLDFFYPQAPILPFVYGAWTNLAGFSLLSLRLLSSLFTIATVALWAWFLYKEYEQAFWVGFASLLLLVCNPFLLTWGVVVKTFALSNFLATIALISIWRFLAERKMAWLIGAGVACGFLVSTRLLYIGVPVAIGGWLLLRAPKMEGGIGRTRLLLAFASGLFIACVPAFVLFLSDPGVFLFNNVGYHQLRSETPVRLVQFMNSLQYLKGTFLVHPYMIVQVVLVGVGVFGLIRQKSPGEKQKSSFAEIAIGAIVALVGVSLTPFPLYEQYFTSPLAPLFIPLVGMGIHTVWKWNRIVLAVCLMVAALVSYAEFDNEETQASAMSGWQMATFEDVAARIQRHTVETDTVISPWPGYACESGRQFLPGLENQFALPISANISPADQKRYRIAGKDSIISALNQGKGKVVVIGAWVSSLFVSLGESDRKEFYHALSRNYEIAEEIENVLVYVRKR